MLSSADCASFTDDSLATVPLSTDFAVDTAWLRASVAFVTASCNDFAAACTSAVVASPLAALAMMLSSADCASFTDDSLATVPLSTDFAVDTAASRSDLADLTAFCNAVIASLMSCVEALPASAFFNTSASLLWASFTAVSPLTGEVATLFASLTAWSRSACALATALL